MHTHTPARQIYTNFQLHCVFSHVLLTVLRMGMGMGMNVTAQICLPVFMRAEAHTPGGRTVREALLELLGS